MIRAKDRGDIELTAIRVTAQLTGYSESDVRSAIMNRGENDGLANEAKAVLDAMERAYWRGFSTARQDLIAP